MSESPIRFAVLGMLKLRPMTGYEIKQTYERGPANFMSVGFGQIYPVLAKLRQEKMARAERERSGRETVRHFITPRGEETLREWLFSPADASNYRELLLRLFFAAPADLAGLRGHVEAFRREEQSSLVHYDKTRTWLEEARARDPRLPVWKMVLEYGVLQSESRVRWADQALALMTNRKKKQKS